MKRLLILKNVAKCRHTVAMTYFEGAMLGLLTGFAVDVVRGTIVVFHKFFHSLYRKRRYVQSQNQYQNNFIFSPYDTQLQEGIA